MLLKPRRDKKNYIRQTISTITYTQQHIIETYPNLFEELSSNSKMELIESLSKSLKKEKKSTDNSVYKSFGAFGYEKPAKNSSRNTCNQEMYNEIKLT